MEVALLISTEFISQDIYYQARKHARAHVHFFHGATLALYIAIYSICVHLQDDPYIHEVRTIIKKAFKYDRADPCKIKIEFNKKLKPIFLKASSEVR